MFCMAILKTPVCYLACLVLLLMERQFFMGPSVGTEQSMLFSFPVYGQLDKHCSVVCSYGSSMMVSGRIEVTRWK